MKRIHEKYRIGSVSISGGVAANGYLKEEIGKFAKERSMGFYVPSMALCTDNAAMIAYTGYQYLKRKVKSDIDIEARPDLPVTGLKTEV